jgi:hypothetical protein
VSPTTVAVSVAVVAPVDGIVVPALEGPRARAFAEGRVRTSAGAGGVGEAVEVRRGGLGWDLGLDGGEQGGRARAVVVGGGERERVWGRSSSLGLRLGQWRALCGARMPLFVGVAVAEVRVGPARMRFTWR